MTSTQFLFAALGLLLTPGPTNTLIGLSGAQRGLKGLTRLLPAELLGYLCAILPLGFLGSELFGHWPRAAVLLKGAAALWVMILAVGLWGRQESAAAEVTPRRIYVTTLLNPKALVFGLVLLPAPADPHFLPRLGLFCLTVVAVALAWGCAGVLARGAEGDGRRLRTVRRLASVWLAVVSVTLIAGLAGA